MRNLDFSILIPYLPLVRVALQVTLIIGVTSFVLALIIAIGVGTLRAVPQVLPRKTAKPHWLGTLARALATAYVEFFRGTPLLVQLFLVYYGLPAFGILISPIAAAITCLALNSGAYLSEVVRSALLAVDIGQAEAAKVLGYKPWQTLSQIILPQAMRIAVPPFMNAFTTIIKETSLASILPLVELTRLGNQIYAVVLRPFEIYIALALMYFVLTYPVTFLARWLEKRLSLWLA